MAMEYPNAYDDYSVVNTIQQTVKKSRKEANF